MTEKPCRACILNSKANNNACVWRNCDCVCHKTEKHDKTLLGKASMEKPLDRMNNPLNPLNNPLNKLKDKWSWKTLENADNIDIAFDEVYDCSRKQALAEVKAKIDERIAKLNHEICIHGDSDRKFVDDNYAICSCEDCELNRAKCLELMELKKAFNRAFEQSFSEKDLAKTKEMSE